MIVVITVLIDSRVKFESLNSISGKRIFGFASSIEMAKHQVESYADGIPVSFTIRMINRSGV